MADYKNKTEEELLQEAKELCKQLLILLPTKVKCKSVTAPPNERIPFKAELFRTGQLYRVVDITETIIDLFGKKKVIPATILVRCVFESAALCFKVYRRLKQVVETNKLGDIDFFLMKAGVGGRSESAPKAPDGSMLKALDISKAINTLNKKYNGLSADYGFLCEFAHPNCPSGIIAYGILNKDEDVYNFSLDATYINMSQPARYGLIMLILSLNIFSHYCEEMGDILPQFTQICNKKKTK